jgi:hypothetical protein
MLLPVLRFFQRYALVFAILTGVLARRFVLPNGGQWWLELGITLAVTGAVYFLLYKDGVTENRRGVQARLKIIEIIGMSVLYWYVMLYALFLFLLLVGIPATDWLPFGQRIDWFTVLAIAALVLAAVIYALGLRCAIRHRRHFWS